MLRYLSSTAALAAFCVLLTGCAKPPPQLAPAESVHEVAALSAYVAPEKSRKLLARYRHTALTGRTLHVASQGDIQLRKGEVVLTFDDGPSPKLTNTILDALDAYHVKATFLVVGQMADAHPKTVQQVALRGHTIGTHTHDHADLAHETHNGAMGKIRAGYRAVARALAPIEAEPSPFFRFPYLSETRLLRASLADDHMVVLGVDVDSSDYLKSTPEQVLNRTLARLDARGGGIILFHDIQARTAAMLPDFLEALEARHYEVVHLTPDRRGLFGKALVTAGLENENAITDIE